MNLLQSLDSLVSTSHFPWLLIGEDYIIYKYLFILMNLYLWEEIISEEVK